MGLDKGVANGGEVAGLVEVVIPGWGWVTAAYSSKAWFSITTSLGDSISPTLVSP